MLNTGFPYIANDDAQVLILGSMPGVKSLHEQQYYAHRQNSFWPIMAQLFGFDVDLDYAQRLQCLCRQRIALWDVAHTCVRQGSLDQAIAMDTVVANDFAGFLKQHNGIQHIFFNGRKAQQLYRQLVLQGLKSNIPLSDMRSINMHLLPSTSPAHASMARAEKYVHWSIVKKTLESQ